MAEIVRTPTATTLPTPSAASVAGRPVVGPIEREEFRLIYGRLRRFAAVAADSDMDPDDVVQDALVGLLSARRPVDDVEAYLRRAIVNRVKNQRRLFARRREEPLGEHDLPVAPTTTDLSVLRRVRPRDRALLYMLDVEERSSAQVSAILGLSEVAVRSRASRARRSLRTKLESEGDRP